MRYLVKAKLKSSKKRPLIRAINNGSLGRGSVAGDEYLHDMGKARVDKSGTAIWVETCFCDPPLAEERPYWEEYFELLSVKDAHSRRKRNRAVGLLRLRLHKGAGGKTPNSRNVISQHVAVAEKQFLDPPAQLRPRDAVRRNSSFVIRASSLVESCFIASTSKRSRPNTSTHHDASICFLITGANAI